MEEQKQKRTRKKPQKRVIRRWTAEETAWWKRIYIYVEQQIFGYADNMKLQKNAVLRLQGLANGKVVTNNNVADNGHYPPQVVYAALVLAKPGFQTAKEKIDFDNEEGAVAYLCAIARNHLNNAYKSYIKKLQTEIVSKGILPVEHDGADFIPKNGNRNSDEGLW